MISKSRKFLFLIIFLSTFITISCNKYKDYSTPTKIFPDVSKPVISITTPINNNSYNGKDYRPIVGTVTDNYLQKLKISVFRIDSSKMLFVDSPIVLGKNGFTINSSFYPNLGNQNIPCYLLVEATDSANNYSLDSIRFNLY